MTSIISKYKHILIFHCVNVVLLALLSMCITRIRIPIILLILPLIGGYLQILQTRLFKAQIIKEFCSIKNFEMHCVDQGVKVFPDYKRFYILGYTPFIWGIYFGKLNISNELNYMKKGLIVPIILFPIELCLIIISFTRLFFN